MKKIPSETIIYGGAFNPPTLAHQAILQACIDYAEPRGADVWLLPSGNRADKTIAVPNERRLVLCDALLRDVTKRSVQMRIEPFELDRTMPTQTYETVLALQSKYPGRHFVWVFGGDSVASMPGWVQGSWLMWNLPMLVFDRPWSPLVRTGGTIKRLLVEPSSLSSSEVRCRMSANEHYENLVGPHVYTELRRAVVS